MCVPQLVPSLTVLPLLVAAGGSSTVKVRINGRRQDTFDIMGEFDRPLTPPVFLLTQILVKNKGATAVTGAAVDLTLASGLTLRSLTPALPASDITGVIRISLSSPIPPLSWIYITAIVDVASTATRGSALLVEGKCTKIRAKPLRWVRTLLMSSCMHVHGCSGRDLPRHGDTRTVREAHYGHLRHRHKVVLLFRSSTTDRWTVRVTHQPLHVSLKSWFELVDGSRVIQHTCYGLRRETRKAETTRDRLASSRAVRRLETYV